MVKSDSNLKHSYALIFSRCVPSMLFVGSRCLQGHLWTPEDGR